VFHDNVIKLYTKAIRGGVIAIAIFDLITSNAV